MYVGDLEEGSWGSAIRLTLTPDLRREDTKSKGGTGIHENSPDRAYLDAHAPRVSGSPQSTLVLCRVLRIGNHRRSAVVLGLRAAVTTKNAISDQNLALRAAPRVPQVPLRTMEG